MTATSSGHWLIYRWPDLSLHNVSVQIQQNYNKQSFIYSSDHSKDKNIFSLKKEEMYTCCRVAGEIQYAVPSPVKRSVKNLNFFRFFLSAGSHSRKAAASALETFKLQDIHLSREQLPWNFFDTLLCSTLIHMLVCSVLPGAFTPPLRFFLHFLDSLQSPVRQGSDVSSEGESGGEGGDPRELGSSPGRHFTSVRVVWGGWKSVNTMLHHKAPILWTYNWKINSKKSILHVEGYSMHNQAKEITAAQMLTDYW